MPSETREMELRLVKDIPPFGYWENSLWEGTKAESLVLLWGTERGIWEEEWNESREKFRRDHRTPLKGFK
jgi:hypothetical protein